MDLYEKLHRKFCLIGGSFFPFNGKYSEGNFLIWRFNPASWNSYLGTVKTEMWKKLEGEYNGYIDGY